MCQVLTHLKNLGIELPPAPAPVAAYVPAVLQDKWLYVSGQLPLQAGLVTCKGKVGQDATLEEAYTAARLCTINALSIVLATLGDLDRVEQVVRVGGFVNSAAGFTDQPKVINGASELLGQVFGEQGRHARAAVGVSELPLNAAVEVEFLFAVRGA